MEKKSTAVYKLYTDGACSGNPGKGGWAAILLENEGELTKSKKKLSGAFEMTTNNRMELMALIMGLENTKNECKIDFYSDSQYIVNALTKGWLTSWKSNGWRTSAKKPVANRDLWEKIITLIQLRKISPFWVRGHNGHAENEECDELAVKAIESGPFQKDEGYSKSDSLF